MIWYGSIIIFPFRDVFREAHLLFRRILFGGFNFCRVHLTYDSNHRVSIWLLGAELNVIRLFPHLSFCFFRQFDIVSLPSVDCINNLGNNQPFTSSDVAIWMGSDSDADVFATLSFSTDVSDQCRNSSPVGQVFFPLVNDTQPPRSASNFSDHHGATLDLPPEHSNTLVQEQNTLYPEQSQVQAPTASSPGQVCNSNTPSNHALHGAIHVDVNPAADSGGTFSDCDIHVVPDEEEETDTRVQDRKLVSAILTGLDFSLLLDTQLGRCRPVLQTP